MQQVLYIIRKQMTDKPYQCSTSSGCHQMAVVNGTLKIHSLCLRIAMLPICRVNAVE